jgi:hypothetical protein
MIYYGPQPQFDENETITVTSSSEAAQFYISAALRSIDLAENLMGNNENTALKVSLQQAISELSLAQSSADEDQKMLHAKNSIENSGAVIKVLGKPPSTRSLLDLDLIFYAVVALAVAATVAGVAYAVWKRAHPDRRSSRRFH